MLAGNSVGREPKTNRQRILPQRLEKLNFQEDAGPPTSSDRATSLTEAGHDWPSDEVSTLIDLPQDFNGPNA